MSHTFHRYKIGDEPVAGYRLTDHLGAGGFGEVWKANAPGGTEVALKIIDLTGQQGVQEFASLRVVKKVRHPNLISLQAFWMKDEEGKLTGTESILPSISSSGRFVAFLAVTPGPKSSDSAAHAQSSGPNSGLRQVFVRDTCLGASNCTPKTTRISLQPGDTPANSSKPAGPSLAGLAKQIALSDGSSSTVFTPTMPVDDRVFLAIPKEKQ